MANYHVERWNYHWSAEYGSKHWSVVRPDREGQDPVPVAAASLSDDGAAVSLAALCVNWGNLLADTSRSAPALARFAEGLRVGGELYSREPSNGVARGMLLTLHGARAEVHGRLGRYREAVLDWDRVVELADEPQHRGYRLNRVDVLAWAGDHARAAAEAEALAAGASALECYNLACALALAAAAAGGSDTEAHADLAVKLLQQSAAAGFFRDPANAANFRQDRDLDALRGRADFEQLVGQGPPTAIVGGK